MEHSKIRSILYMKDIESSLRMIIAVLNSTMAQEYSYLKEGPEGLLENCDILLCLDDSSKLPVHSSVLARCSPLFNGMANEGALSKATAGSMVTVPFTDCSQEEATSFLSALYSLKPQKHINETTNLSIARLADKCGVKVGIYTTAPVTFSRVPLHLGSFCFGARCYNL